MPKIKLRAVPGAFQLYSKRKVDPAFKKFSQKVLHRDRFTCQFCGFQARDHQEIINLDHNYRNNKINNLVTSCVFCAQCHFMESIGQANEGGGTLIYLPEMSQEQLNSLCHVLFCAISNDTGYKATAQSIYRNFKFRSQVVEGEFGEGTSEPNVLGQLFIDNNVDEKKRSSILKPVRVLPSRVKFSKQIEHWAKSALNEMSDQ